MSVTCKCRSSNRRDANITRITSANALGERWSKFGADEKVRRSQPTKITAGGGNLRAGVPRDMGGGYFGTVLLEKEMHRETTGATRRERSLGRRTHGAEQTRAEGENL